CNQCNNYYLYIEECKHRMLFSLLFYLFCCIISVVVIVNDCLGRDLRSAGLRPIRNVYISLIVK
ncbi:MAG: hypothetical protein KKH88_04500, partial [Nanoarchaeota archaeon]|nr:hypothetical protein [Nanoarchaeota archaeon]